MSFESYSYYTLSDGRIWDIKNGAFVESVPSGEQSVPCIGEDGKSSDEEALRFNLRFFGWPLGELATDEDLAKAAREKRNALIAETDYMVMPDYPLDDKKKADVLAYRQVLRDVPEQAGFPRQIDWPVKP